MLHPAITVPAQTWFEHLSPVVHAPLSLQEAALAVCVHPLAALHAWYNVHVPALKTI